MPPTPPPAAPDGRYVAAHASLYWPGDDGYITKVPARPGRNDRRRLQGFAGILRSAATTQFGKDAGAKRLSEMQSRVHIRQLPAYLAVLTSTPRLGLGVIAMCIAEAIAITKDVVLTVGAVVAMYVAVRGLNTWNRQLKGGVEYDLTRRLLKCTYRLREAIKAVRNPVMFANELPNPPDAEAHAMSSEQRRYYGLSQAYQGRWNKVTETRNDLQTELLEAEVIWGKVIHEQFEPLFALQRELFSDIHAYLMVCNPSEGEDSRHAMSEIRRKRREVLYDTSSFEPDPYTDDVEKAIAGIETFLKPHLKK